jgi:hypothetical protein
MVLNLLKKNFYFLLIVPVLINLISNLFLGNFLYEYFYTYNVISSLLMFLFFYSIGYSFKSINKKMTITFGIITYLFSYFILESIALFFYTGINLDITFLLTNFLWFIYFIFLLDNKKLLIINFFLYFLMFYFNNQFVDVMTVNANLSMDVANVFFPNTLNIYEKSYYISISEPVMLGYPQFMSYIDALIFKISFGLKNYYYFMSSSFLFIWLYLLLFHEIKTSNKNKLFVSLFFIFLISNSSWLQFLFTSSLMSERIAGYLFAGILLTLFSVEKPSFTEISFIYFILSFVYLTKQFFSVIVLISIVWFYFNKHFRKAIIFLTSALVINEIAYRTYFLAIPQEHHLRQIDMRDTLLDLLLLRDLRLQNILEIFKNLWIDKPMTYLILIFFTSYIYAVYRKKVDLELNTYFFASLANLLFILILYVSAWRQMELESPIRYIYSFLIVYFLVILKSFDSEKK